MLGHRFALRCLVLASVVSAFFTMLLVSKPVGSATEAPQPRSAPANAQQVALLNHGRTSTAFVPTASGAPARHLSKPAMRLTASIRPSGIIR